MKRRGFLKGLFSIPVAAVALPPVLNNLPVPQAHAWKRPGHYVCIYYFRRAFDLHASGLTRQEAQKRARLESTFEGVDAYTVFPPVPWDKYEATMAITRGMEKP